MSRAQTTSQVLVSEKSVRPVPQPQQKASTPPASANRIRDNQRRSRARRKAHLEDVQRSLRLCQAQGVEAAAEIQRAARKVAEENRALRMLLRRVGVEDGRVEEFLREMGGSQGIGAERVTGGAVDELEEVMRPRRAACLGDGEEALEAVAAMASGDDERTAAEGLGLLRSQMSAEPGILSPSMDAVATEPGFERSETEQTPKVCRRKTCQEDATRLQGDRSTSPMLSGDSNCIVATEIVSTMTGADPQSIRSRFGCSPCDPDHCQVDDSTLHMALDHYSARAG